MAALSRALVASLSIAGCGGGGECESALALSGKTMTTVAARVESNLFFLDATVDGASAVLTPDTGSPITLIDPAKIPSAKIASDSKVDITLGDLSISKASVFQSMAPSIPTQTLSGLFGADLMCHFSAAFDYAAKSFELHMQPDMNETVTIPFSLAGGFSSEGSGIGTAIPATRILIDATIEGQKGLFLLDTGSSLVALDDNLFGAITADGRTKEDETSFTVKGSSSLPVTRSRSMELAGQVVDNVVVTDAGSLLAGLVNEVKRPVNGLLGGTFLREFKITVDYRTGMLGLLRYPNRDHVQDEYVRIAIGLRPSSQGLPTSYTIGRVTAGSDADKKGLRTGMTVQRIDGQDLSMLDVFQANALLFGKVGDVHTVDLGATSVSVMVENLLPLP